MGWFGKNDKDDLKKHSEKLVKDAEEEEIEESEEEDSEDEEEEGDGDDEEEEPEKECTFQYNWDTDNKAWSCDLTDNNIYCDKTKCPFYKK